MNRSALNRATESSDSPTPGYLYVDIAKSAAASPVASQEVVSFLINRLQSKKHPNIKYKCLKVIAKTSESSLTRGQFKRSVVQDARAVGAIKECLNFRGPPDPVRGEEPFQKVREAAKEALEAVYTDTPSNEMALPQTGNYGGIGGGGASSSYGASPHSGGGYNGPPGGGWGGGGGGGGGSVGVGGGGAGGGPRKMEGIGNPMFKDQQSKGGAGSMSIGQVAAVAGETIVGMIRDPLARNAPTPPPQNRGGQGGYGGPNNTVSL